MTLKPNSTAEPGFSYDWSLSPAASFSWCHVAFILSKLPQFKVKNRMFTQKALNSKSHFMLGFIWLLTMKRPNTPRSTPPLKLWDFSSGILVVSSKWDHSVRIAIQMSLINYSISASLELEPSCAVKWVGSRMFILRKYPWLQMKWFKYLERTLHGCSVMWKTMAFTKNTMAWLGLSCESVEEDERGWWSCLQSGWVCECVSVWACERGRTMEGRGGRVPCSIHRTLVVEVLA